MHSKCYTWAVPLLSRAIGGESNPSVRPKTTKIECLQDPEHAIFSENRGFKDIEYYILAAQPVNFLLVNKNRKDQRLKYHRPNSRTYDFVLLTFSNYLLAKM